MISTFFLLAQVSWLKDRHMRAMQAAYSLALAELAVDYDCPTPSVAVASSLIEIPETASPIIYQDTMPVAGDDAFHTFAGGRPYSVVLADPDEVTLADVQEGGSHEAKESTVDPECTKYMRLPNGDETPLEPCDPAQGQAIPYTVDGETVLIADHVTPGWYDLNARVGARLCASGKITASLTVGGQGYVMRQAPTGAVSMVGPGPLAMTLARAVPIGPHDPHPRIHFAPAAYKRAPTFHFGRRLAAMHARAIQMGATR